MGGAIKRRKDGRNKRWDEGGRDGRATWWVSRRGESRERDNEDALRVGRVSDASG